MDQRLKSTFSSFRRIPLFPFPRVYIFLAGLACLAIPLSTGNSAGGVELSAVSARPDHPHLVKAGTQTTFVISVYNNSAIKRSIFVAIDPNQPAEWEGDLHFADSLFRATGQGFSSVSFGLEAQQKIQLLAGLKPSAGLSDGEEGGAVITAISGEIPQSSLTVRAKVRNQPKLYFVALDGCGPGYLNLDRKGRPYSGGAERLMPRTHEFNNEAAFFPSALSLLPASTDVDHTAALSGSWPGTLGIPSIRRYYAGKDTRGNPVFLTASKEILRWGPEGLLIQTIYDLMKDPGAGGTPDAFSIFLSGKEWVGDLYRDEKGTVDIIAGGREHPEYVPDPAPFRLGDPPSDPDAGRDREGTNATGGKALLKRFSLKARTIGGNPQAFPEDRWTAEAAVRMIAAEDPDILYTLLAECDTAQHTFGAADRPEEWTDAGTPDILWDDLNAFNERANRDPILDIVYEADQSFGLILDALRSRGTLEQSIVVLLSDHAQITALASPLDIGQILLQKGVAREEVEFLFSRHTVAFLFLADPARRGTIESALEDHQEFHPVLKTSVKPFIVLNREEMDSGFDSVEGLLAEDSVSGNQKGELYSEWAIDYPVADNSKVRWPDLIVFTRHHFQNVLMATDTLGAGVAGPKTLGTHSTPITTRIPLAIGGAGILPGVYTEKASLADIAPTLYQILGIVPPPHIDGKVLEPILAR